jgi:hypothetical protein
MISEGVAIQIHKTRSLFLMMDRLLTCDRRYIPEQRDVAMRKSVSRFSSLAKTKE